MKGNQTEKRRGEERELSILPFPEGWMLGRDPGFTTPLPSSLIFLLRHLFFFVVLNCGGSSREASRE